MGIQEIVAYVGPKTSTGQHTPAGTREWKENVRGENSDLSVISGKAKLLQEADESQKFDAIRERVRLGYYFKGDVLDQVIDALAREFGTEHPSQAAV